MMDHLDPIDEGREKPIVGVYPWPLPGLIRQWNAELQAGGGITPEPGNAYQLAISLALARRSNGLGPDATDRLGADAMQVVERAISGVKAPIERISAVEAEQDAAT